MKDKALGFLKKWRDDLTLIHITAMMIDILGVYQAFEKRMQTDHVIIPDIIRYRDQAVEKLKLFQELGYLPGGKLDSKHSKNHSQYTSSVFQDQIFCCH